MNIKTRDCDTVDCGFPFPSLVWIVYMNLGNSLSIHSYLAVNDNSWGRMTFVQRYYKLEVILTWLETVGVWSRDTELFQLICWNSKISQKTYPPCLKLGTKNVCVWNSSTICVRFHTETLTNDAYIFMYKSMIAAGIILYGSLFIKVLA